MSILVLGRKTSLQEANLQAATYISHQKPFFLLPYIFTRVDHLSISSHSWSIISGLLHRRIVSYTQNRTDGRLSQTAQVH